jgi:type IV pilus assembly protein PilM
VKLTQRYPIAIDMSCPDEMSAVQLATQGGRPRIHAMIQQAATTGSDMPTEADRMGFIQEVMHERGFKGKHVALLPPLDMLVCYPLRVELGKQETLEEGIVREATTTLGFPLEEAILDYASVLPDPGGQRNITEVLIIAARSDDVNRCTRQVQGAGGSLEILESAATALVRVHMAATAQQPQGPALLCNVGRRRSEIVVVHGNGIVAHRNVNWGTNRLRRKLVENLELAGGDRDADFLLRNHGLADTEPSSPGDAPAPSSEAPLGDSVAHLVASLVDAFVHELHSVAGYVRSRVATVTFEGVFLYGDGASVCGLDRHVEEELGIPTTSVDPFQGLGLSTTVPPPGVASNESYALALGLALRRYQWL